MLVCNHDNCRPPVTDPNENQWLYAIGIHMMAMGWHSLDTGMHRAEFKYRRDVMNKLGFSVDCPDEIIRRFAGLKVNVQPITRRQFWAHMGKIYDRNLPTAKQDKEAKDA
jgi:hypothetical protein